MMQPMQTPQAPAAQAPQGPMSNTIYQQRLMEIKSMPPGPQQEAALAKLARDYQGEQAAAARQSSQGMEMSGTPTPQGTQTGGRYGTYVAANPLQHLASGLRQYKGYKGMKKAEDKLEGLSKDKQAALIELLRAGLGGQQTSLPGIPQATGYRGMPGRS